MFDLLCGQTHPLAGPVDLPLCARCTGIWVVLGIGLLCARRPVAFSWRWSLGRIAAAAALVAVAPVHAFAAPAAGDLARLAAGAAAGAGLSILLGRSPAAAGLAAGAVILVGATRSLAGHLLLAVATPAAVAYAVGSLGLALLRPALAPLPEGGGDAVSVRVS